MSGEEDWRTTLRGPSSRPSPPQRVMNITIWKMWDLVQQPSLSTVQVGHMLELGQQGEAVLLTQTREVPPASEQRP